MTLVLAMACGEGIVMGADSASSDLDSGMKQLTEKIKRIGQAPILYGGSGDVGLIQKISDGLSSLVVPSSLKRIRQEIKKIVVSELRDSKDDHVPYPLPGYNIPPIGVLLCAGVCNGIPWILEVEKDGRDTMYGGADLGGFAAIGSGKPLAQALFRAHLATKRDMKLSKVFTYRILEDAIALASSGLSEPINMHTISIAGTVEQVSAEELGGLAETAELWRSLEREAVGKLLTTPAPEPNTEPTAAGPAPADIPTPRE